MPVSLLWIGTTNCPSNLYASHQKASSCTLVPRRDLFKPRPQPPSASKTSGLHSPTLLPQQPISHQFPLFDSLNVCCQVPVSALQAFRA
ncbi:hypothetical protein FALCPG4_010782 [Fusarium falciforme]